MAGEGVGDEGGGEGGGHGKPAAAPVDAGSAQKLCAHATAPTLDAASSSRCRERHHPVAAHEAADGAARALVEADTRGASPARAAL